MQPSGGSKARSSQKEDSKEGPSRKQPWRWGRHGASLEELLGTGFGGSVASHTPYTAQGATGIYYYYYYCICYCYCYYYYYHHHHYCCCYYCYHY
jgi:hypothetical protein